MSISIRQASATSSVRGRMRRVRIVSPLFLVALLAACSPKVDEPAADTGLPTDVAVNNQRLGAVAASYFTATDTGSTYDTDIDGSPTDTDTGTDSATDTGGDTDTDTATDTGGTDTDTGGDTDTDTGECVSGTPDATGPDLLTAAPFAVLGGSTITNLGATVITGDLGLSPGSAVTGFPPGLVVGVTVISDATADAAKVDLTAAYTDAATRSGATPLPEDISGLTLVPGIYSASSSLQIASADLTLDGGGDPNATWIFQIGSTLTTSSDVDVVLAGCADAANVYWQVGTSATLGTGTKFVGTLLADQSITAGTGVTVDGRLLASVGAVTLDTTFVTAP